MPCQEGPGTVFPGDVRASGLVLLLPPRVGCSPCWTVPRPGAGVGSSLCWTVPPSHPIFLPGSEVGLVPIVFVGKHRP